MTAAGAPTPPILVIRPGIAFWVEAAAPEAWTATAQAMAEGCWTDCLCCDAGGGAWAVLAAAPAGPTPLVPWRRMPVAVCLGPRRDMALPDLRALLEGVLSTDGSFAEAHDVTAARAAFAAAPDAGALIAAARALD
ncbi:hypothetical protein [Roseomonas sp. HF4]|uniref:hypothetical protein n=1 Tax=Roseomonas sp. HF4 TaxID=2562313 RepID=UPI0010C05D60|nr:hypothetical protein [Roseomonas sp. HF4]